MRTWLTLNEIAEDLRVPAASVYSYRRRGDGPRTYKFGKHLRVSADDYREWLREHATH